MQTTPQENSAPATRRIVLLHAHEIAGRKFPLGQVLAVPPGIAQRLIAAGAADDTPLAIDTALANAAREELAIERELAVRDAGLKGVARYQGFSASDIEAPRLADIRARKSVVALRISDCPVALAAVDEVDVPAVSTRPAFAEATEVLSALEADLHAMIDEIERKKQELDKAPLAPVDLVALARSGKALPATPQAQVREELASLDGRREVLVRAIELQRARVERAREAQGPVAVAELQSQRAIVARKVLDALKLLGEAEALEDALERGLRRGGYGLEVIPRLGLAVRLPLDARDIFAQCARDAESFLESAERAPIVAKAGLHA